MSFNVTLSATGSALIRSSYPSTPYKPGASWIYGASTQTMGWMLTQFAQLAAQYKQYPVESAVLRINTTTLNMLTTDALRGSFNVDTVTWDTKPSFGYDLEDLYSGDRDYVTREWSSYSFETIAYVVNNGFVVKPYSSNYNNNAIYTASSSAKKPTITITFGSTKVTKIATNLRSSYSSIPYGQRNKVFWDHQNSGGTAFEYPTISSEKLYYKLGSGSWTNVTVTGSVSYQMPAFTPSANTTVTWYIATTDSNGVTNNSVQRTFTAEAQAPAPAQAAPTLRAPIDTTVDASAVIAFQWARATPTSNLGNQEFEIRVSGSSSTLWSNTYNNAATSFSLPANTLTAGEYQWRGRSYNADNTAGSWSSWASFTAIAAPPAPIVTATSAPKPTVTWESDQQEAYQVRIGSYDTGTMYGAASTFLAPEFLPNGDVLIEVRVLNRYNLWSPWGSTRVTIANVPGSSIPVISAAATEDAVLTWTAVSGVVKYHVYRNGVWIAETTSRNYTDKWSVGETEYFIRAEKSGYNYADSNPVTLTIAVDSPIITDVTIGEWIHLRYTTEPVSQSSMTHSQMVSYMVLSGSEYPVAEMSPHREQTLQIRVAFQNGEEKVFEALLGRECYIKDQYGTAFRGVMDSISSSRNRFYAVCTAILRRVAE